LLWEMLLDNCVMWWSPYTHTHTHTLTHTGLETALPIAKRVKRKKTFANCQLSTADGAIYYCCCGQKEKGSK